MEDKQLRGWWYSDEGRIPIARLTAHTLKQNPNLFDTEYSKSRNKDNLRRFAKEWRERNPLSHRISSQIRRTLRGKKNGAKWKSLVDFTLNDLRRHLEKQFTDGMSWANFGEWQIDHIIPISAFRFTSPDDIDFKRCWALKNLRPLWMIDNRKKYNKVTKPFQFSLHNPASPPESIYFPIST